MQTFAKQSRNSSLSKENSGGVFINQQVRNILHAGVQPKLKIGAVNDPAEVEADRVADQVMRMPAPDKRPTANDTNPVGQILHGESLRRKCAGCDEEDNIRRKPADRPVIRRKGGGAPGGSEAGAAANSAIHSLGPGTPLPKSERAFFEPRFGRDLSGVRIHTGGNADTASRAISARAFSLGNNIAFAGGEYQPGIQSGRTLMAHEITHTLQGGSAVNRIIRRIPEQIVTTADEKSKRTVLKKLLESLPEINEYLEIIERYAEAKPRHNKSFLPPPLNLPLLVLKKAGVRTNTTINRSTASLIQTTLERSRVLRPHIGDKLKKIMIPKNFNTDSHDINQKHDSFYGITRSPGEKFSIGGFYDRKTDTIYLPNAGTFSAALHESIHKFSEPDLTQSFGKFINEGVTQYFTNRILQEQELGDDTRHAYNKNLEAAGLLVEHFGEDVVAKAYFEGDTGPLSKAFRIKTGLDPSTPIFNLDDDQFLGKLKNIK